MKVYVVTAPEAIRGVYETWDACRAAVSGVPGARYQAVESRERAEALPRGEPVALPPGTWAFVGYAGLVGDELELVGLEAVRRRLEGGRSPLPAGAPRPRTTSRSPISSGPS